jgi:hypothetical protein
VIDSAGFLSSGRRGSRSAASGLRLNAFFALGAGFAGFGSGFGALSGFAR